MAFTAPRSDYENYIRERNKNIEGVSEWERLFLQPLSQQYESSVKEAQKQAHYDISQAYSNYKRNQMRLMQQNIDTSSQKQITSGLKSVYDSAYNKANQNLAYNINTINTEAQKVYAENQQQIQNLAGDIQKIHQLTLEKAGLGELSYDDLVAQKYLTKNVNADGTTSYEMTDRMRNLFQQQWYGADTATNSFEEYIRNSEDLSSDEMERLVNSLYTNQNLLNESIGLDANQRSINEELLRKANTIEAELLFEAQKEDVKEKLDTQSITVTQPKADYFSYGDFDVIIDWFSSWGGKENKLSSKKTRAKNDLKKYMDELGVTAEEVGINIDTIMDDIEKIARNREYDKGFNPFDIPDTHKYLAEEYDKIVQQIYKTAKKKYFGDGDKRS